MDKKYQVFVSSTYEDLQEERKALMDALLQIEGGLWKIQRPIGILIRIQSDDELESAEKDSGLTYETIYNHG